MTPPRTSEAAFETVIESQFLAANRIDSEPPHSPSRISALCNNLAIFARLCRFC
jgi:hypothetical protein